MDKEVLQPLKKKMEVNEQELNYALREADQQYASYKEHTPFTHVLPTHAKDLWGKRWKTTLKRDMRESMIFKNAIKYGNKPIDIALAGIRVKDPEKFDTGDTIRVIPKTGDESYAGHHKILAKEANALVIGKPFSDNASGFVVNETKRNEAYRIQQEKAKELSRKNGNEIIRDIPDLNISEDQPGGSGNMVRNILLISAIGIVSWYVINQS